MAAMDLGLRDRVYLITGGSRGLGLATAQALAADGAQVVLSARDAAAVADAAAGLGGPGQAVGITADNADPDAAARLLAASREAFGRLDGVLISVGGPPGGATDGGRRRRLAGRVRERVPGRGAAGPAGRRRAGRRRLDRVRAVLVGPVADPRAGHLQRPAAGPGRGGQDPGRRAGPARDPGERAAARPDRHRPGPVAGRAQRRPGRGAGPAVGRDPAAPLRGGRGVREGGRVRAVPRGQLPDRADDRRRRRRCCGPSSPGGRARPCGQRRGRPARAAAPAGRTGSGTARRTGRRRPAAPRAGRARRPARR